MTSKKTETSRECEGVGERPRGRELRKHACSCVLSRPLAATSSPPVSTTRDVPLKVAGIELSSHSAHTCLQILEHIGVLLLQNVRPGGDDLARSKFR
eukprot:6203445-Pleurochrysis_carterae.AAC.1